MQRSKTLQGWMAYWLKFGAALCAALLILSGCAVRQPNLPPVVMPGAKLPPLPPTSRQTQAPPWCLPTCLDALMSERTYWRKLLMNQGREGLPAKPITTAPKN